MQSSALSSAVLSDGLYPTESPVQVHRRGFFSGGESSSSGQFLLDSSLGRDTLFGVYVEDEEEHRIASVEFKVRTTFLFPNK